MEGYFTRKFIQKQTIIIALIDLVLANAALHFGEITMSYPDSDVIKWDLLSYNFIHLAKSNRFQSETLEIISMAVIFIGYILEIGLFILLTDGANKLNSIQLKLWYHIKFILYILGSTIIVTHVASLRGTLQLFVAQSLLGLIILLYRGYSLLMVTLLEERIVTVAHCPNN